MNEKDVIVIANSNFSLNRTMIYVENIENTSFLLSNRDIDWNLSGIMCEQCLCKQTSSSIKYVFVQQWVI